MFSQASVILSTGECLPLGMGGFTPPGRHPLWQILTLPTVTAVDGAHRTGMHSCFSRVHARLSHRFA